MELKKGDKVLFLKDKNNIYYFVHERGDGTAIVIKNPFTFGTYVECMSDLIPYPTTKLECAIYGVNYENIIINSK